VLASAPPSPRGRRSGWPSSSARERPGARAESDVDVGIIPVDAAVSLHDDLALASALSALTNTEVDVVRLDDAAGRRPRTRS
jgi:predicted nucleotidyltransferase